MNGNPLQGAGGIGKAMAEWIIEGRPTQEHLAFDVQRFLDLHNNRMYLQERTKEIVGRLVLKYFVFNDNFHYAKIFVNCCVFFCIEINETK